MSADPRRTWRLHPAAMLAGRIAWQFAICPDVDRVVVVRAGRGVRVVPYGDEGAAEVLGTYDRHAQIGAVLEDFA